MIKIVKKRGNKWDKYNFSERSNKLSELTGYPPDSNEVLGMNYTYTKWKKNDKDVSILLKDYSDSLFIDVFMKTTKTSILMISEIHTRDTITLNINNEIIVYDVDKQIYYKKYGTMFAIGIAVKQDIKENHGNIDSSNMYSVYLFNENKIKDLYDFFVLMLFIVDSKKKSCNIENTNVVYNEFIKNEPIKNVYSHNPYVIKDMIDLSEYYIQDILEEDRSVDFHKEYNDKLFDEHVSFTFDKRDLIIMYKIFNSDIFKEYDKLETFSYLKMFLKSVNIYKTFINGVITKYNDEVDIFAVFVGLYRQLLLKNIKVNVRTNIYSEYKKTRGDKIVNPKKYLMDYVIFVFTVLFPKEYNTLYSEYDVPNIFMNSYMSNYIVLKRPVYSFKYLMLYNVEKDSKNEKFFRIFSDPTDEILHFINSDDRNVSPFKQEYFMNRGVTWLDLMDHYDFDMPVFDEDILNKSSRLVINEPEEKLNKIQYVNYEKDYEYIQLLYEKLNTIPMKKILYLGDSLNKKIDDINDNRELEAEIIEYYDDSKKRNLDKILTEFLMLTGDIKSYKSGTLFKTLYNHDDVKFVKKFLKSKIKTFDLFDISKKSQRLKKINERELMDRRIDIYYNLTPDEKLEIDKLIFGSDEWNDNIDSSEMISDNIELIEQEEYELEEFNDIYDDLNTEGWNDDSID